MTSGQPGSRRSAKNTRPVVEELQTAPRVLFWRFPCSSRFPRAGIGSSTATYCVACDARNRTLDVQPRRRRAQAPPYATL